MELNKIYNIDYLLGLSNIEDKSVNMIVTDPPYRTISGGAGAKGDGSPTGILQKNDGKIFEYNDIDFDKMFSEFNRTLKENSHLYVMVNFLNLEKMMMSGKNAGFKIHNLLVWEKNNSTPNRWYMKNAEYVLFFRKGKAFSINDCGSKTVHKIKNVKDRLHPTQKPVELMELYIKNSTQTGQIVLDPFMGSGTTAIACMNTKRNFIGFEIDKTYHKLSLERLEEHKKAMN